jgi:hypothetical protein
MSVPAMLPDSYVYNILHFHHLFSLSIIFTTHSSLNTTPHTNTQLSTFKSQSQYQSPKLPTSTMGLIKTAIMTGGGIYAVDKLAKSVPLPFPFAYPLIPTY